MNNSSRPHEETIIEVLREDAALAEEYLAVAKAELSEEGGRQALLAARRHVADAQGKA